MRKQVCMSWIFVEDLPLTVNHVVTLRRKATSHYTFSDGLEVKTGTTVYAPLRAMGRDPSHFTFPEMFDGVRFIKAVDSKRTWKTTQSPWDRMQNIRT